MANLKLLAALLMLAFAVSPQECDADLMDLCAFMASEVIYRDLKGQAAIDFSMQYVAKHKSISFDENKMHRALRKIMAGEECSSSSLDYVATIGKCRLDRYPDSMRPLRSIVEAYAAKCLTPEYLKQRILNDTETSGYFRSVSLKDSIDQQFLDDYLAANPKDKEVKLYDVEVYEDKAIVPLSQFIKRLLQKQSQDAGKELDKSFDAVKANLDKYIIKPCKAYRSTALQAWDKILRCGPLMKGGRDGLLSSLDQEAQLAFFRNNFCTGIESHRKGREVKMQRKMLYKEIMRRL